MKLYKYQLETLPRKKVIKEVLEAKECPKTYTVGRERIRKEDVNSGKPVGWEESIYLTEEDDTLALDILALCEVKKVDELMHRISCIDQQIKGHEDTIKFLETATVTVEE